MQTCKLTDKGGGEGWIRARIPASELVIIAGAAHTPQIERAPEFNRVLSEFLARVHEGVAASRRTYLRGPET